jgi:hypothetical protein
VELITSQKEAAAVPAGLPHSEEYRKGRSLPLSALEIRWVLSFLRFVRAVLPERAPAYGSNGSNTNSVVIAMAGFSVRYTGQWSAKKP